MQKDLHARSPTPWAVGNRAASSPPGVVRHAGGAPRRRTSHRWLLLIATAALCGLRTGTAAGPGERITATAISVAAAGGRPTTVTIEISIDRWSTEAERDQLIEALKGGRARALVDRLRSLPAIGLIATPTAAGRSLHFAQTRPREEGGRQVIVATDRPMTLDEKSRSRQDSGYPLTLVEIRFDKDGTGSGTVAYAASLTYEEKTRTIAIAKYGSEPVRLINVQSSPTP